MQQLNFVSIKLTLGLIMGIVIGFYTDVAPFVALVCLAVLLPVLYLANQKQTREGFPYFEVLTLFTLVCLGVFAPWSASGPAS